MIKEFIEKWEKNKKGLEEYFCKNKQGEYYEYEDIVKLLFEKIINIDETIESEKFDIENIHVIDDGDYQGTQIYLIHKNEYQPSIEDYVYTDTYYGSCPGCDTLMEIQGSEEELPNKKQVKAYMTLALHLLQKCKYMKDDM